MKSAVVSARGATGADRNERSYLHHLSWQWRMVARENVGHLQRLRGEWYSLRVTKSVAPAAEAAQTARELIPVRPVAEAASRTRKGIRNAEYTSTHVPELRRVRNGQCPGWTGRHADLP